MPSSKFKMRAFFLFLIDKQQLAKFICMKKFNIFIA